jgi:1,5-anhydro-D-fructose reductase (1,5-anhydro-D-mannitol-forming)
LSDSNRPVGWGFIGSSGWVDSHFASSVKEAGHHVVGAYGSSAKGSLDFAEKHEAKAFASLDALLADDDVDAIWVASPTAQHADHAAAAAAAGRAVLIEKPLTTSAGDAHVLASQIAELGVVAGVGFQHRFNPGVQAVADRLREGVVGTVTTGLIHRSVVGPTSPSPWRTDIAQSAGWSVTDIGTHLLDTIAHLLGPLDLCGARLSSPGRGLAVDDVSTLLFAAGAATVVVRASTSSAGPPPAIEIGGTEGWVRLTDFWAGGGHLSDSTGLDLELPAVNVYALQVAAFSAAVRHGPWQGATIDDGVKIVEIVDAAHVLSTENGREQSQ